MVLVDAGGVGIHLRLGLTYLSFMVGMSLILRVLGHLHGNSLNLNEIYIRYSLLEYKVDIGCIECAERVCQDVFGRRE